MLRPANNCFHPWFRTIVVSPSIVFLYLTPPFSGDLTFSTCQECVRNKHIFLKKRGKPEGWRATLNHMFQVTLHKQEPRFPHKGPPETKVSNPNNLPTTTRLCTCICRLTTSNGYVKVWPNNPAKAPQERRIMMEFSCPSGTRPLSSSYI